MAATRPRDSAWRLLLPMLLQLIVPILILMQVHWVAYQLYLHNK
jgi:hypothetical protein